LLFPIIGDQNLFYIANNCYFQSLVTKFFIFDHLQSPCIELDKSFPKNITCSLCKFATKKCQSPSKNLDFLDGNPNPFLVTNNRVTKTIFQSPTITSFCHWQLNFQSPHVMLDESFPKTYYMSPLFQNQSLVIKNIWLPSNSWTKDLIESSQHYFKWTNSLWKSSFNIGLTLPIIRQHWFIEYLEIIMIRQLASSPAHWHFLMMIISRAFNSSKARL
jgi:hypothetical protein